MREASEAFARAYAMRRPPAKKEEALFWLAKASELAGLREQAKARYLELASAITVTGCRRASIPTCNWRRQDGHADQAAPFAARLREEYPGNKWMLKLD